MTNPAVQAALDAYYNVVSIDTEQCIITHDDEAMQAALNAAFPIMLREVAELDWLDSYTQQQICGIADSYGKP